MEKNLNINANVIYNVSLCQCMHGGLFKDDTVTLDDIRKYDRIRQPPEDGRFVSPRHSKVYGKIIIFYWPFNFVGRAIHKFKITTKYLNCNLFLSKSENPLI